MKKAEKKKLKEEKPEEKPKENEEVTEVVEEEVVKEIEKEIVEEEVPEKLVEEVKEVISKEVEERLATWKPRTKLGQDVFTGKIKNIDEILDSGVKIKEAEIVDFLLPTLQSELIMIGGRPGKGGGIQRTPIRISAKMHRSGRRFSSSAFVIVGNGNGIIGIGKGRAREGRSAVEKAIQKAKLNLIKVPRGCGSLECVCGEPHSIPFITEGKAGSVTMRLMPAPRGVGLTIDNESKKIFRLAGIRDVWAKTLGNTSTRFNLIKAGFEALRNLHKFKTGA